jgi:opine dehydrogenase
MKEAGVTTRVTPVETISLLYATRASEPGVVACIGVKSKLPTAALPASRTAEFLELFNAGRIEATGGKGWNLYADGATESVAKIMLSMDEERMAVLKLISTDGILIKDSFETFYANYSLGKKTLSETLRQSPIHGHPAFPAPSAVDTRYVNEDLPFGLVPWALIGRAWGVPTPTIDAIIQIASIMLNVDYFQKGLSAEDLGIQDMEPRDVKTLIT